MTPHDWATVPDASVPSQQYCRRGKVLKLTAEHTRGFSTRPNEHDGCPAEHVPQTLECPCCGDDGAVSDASGYFTDGQPLMCGCPGMVSVDSESDPFINNGDEPCPKCAPTGDRS
jgi:hypothetical protein